MSAPELFAHLTDELPEVEPVMPIAFVDDDLLPAALALVEPTTFVLECAVANWGPHGPQN